MLTSVIIVLHVIVCITLVLIILLQSGKGADIGAVFGGGSSQTVFGSTGATTFLHKITIGAAVTFMVTSFLLTFYSGRGVSVTEGLTPGQPTTEQPALPADGKPVTPGAGEPAKAEGTATTDSPGKAAPTASKGSPGEVAVPSTKQAPSKSSEGVPAKEEGPPATSGNAGKPEGGDKQ
ncbi:preprotein translocase subunit SecG [Thermodesulfobacteriota bacterium]